MSASKAVKQRLPLLALLVGLVLSGCASQPKFAPLQRLPEGQTLQLLVSVPPIEAAKVDGDAESVGKGAAVGAGGGAAAGATVGLAESLWCGPYILFCAPVFALVGAGGGAIVGGIAGGVGGAIQGLPAEKAAALESIIAVTVAELDVEQTIRHEFDNNNRDFWHVSQSPVTPQLSFAVEAIFVEQFGKNELSLQTITSLVVRYSANETDSTKRILFKFTSDRYHVDHWIARDGANLRQAVNGGLAESVRQAVAALRQ